MIIISISSKTCLPWSDIVSVFSFQNPSAPSPLGQMPPQDGMPGGPGMPPGFFPVSTYKYIF